MVFNDEKHLCKIIIFYKAMTGNKNAVLLPFTSV